MSDLHNKVFGKKNKRLIQSVKEADADIVVLTGDLISRGTSEFNKVYDFIEMIKQINQNVFYVTGNHEMTNDNLEEFINGLRDRGVVVLRNENRVVTIQHIDINLVGIDNESTNHEDMNGAFADVNQGNYTILLSHSPSVVNNYHSIKADLILSGHTHGGQVRFPFVGAIIGPDRSLFPVLDKGVFKITTEQFLYIDSGVGTTGYPVRFLNQSQISLIELKHEME
ncbi:metallophosphoesterase [Ornithinibacillus halotolerans]|uniref:metallophosphoesterase n=1 Tax=Ornithinibacillus halotolerans TaxID=1274357 RepID=UPI001E338608|nr:metallophosphoesterase [Ornithinibacillus halotolerans]